MRPQRTATGNETLLANKYRLSLALVPQLFFSIEAKVAPDSFYKFYVLNLSHLLERRSLPNTICLSGCCASGKRGEFIGFYHICGRGYLLHIFREVLIIQHISYLVL